MLPKQKEKLGWQPKYDIKVLVKDMFDSDFRNIEKNELSEWSNIDPLAYVRGEL